MRWVSKVQPLYNNVPMMSNKVLRNKGALGSCVKVVYTATASVPKEMVR